MSVPFKETLYSLPIEDLMACYSKVVKSKDPFKMIDDVTYQMVLRNIKRLTKLTKEIKQDIKDLDALHIPPHEKAFITRAVWQCQDVREIFYHLENLKAIAQKCEIYTSKYRNKVSPEKKPLDVDRAKNVPIESLYNFEQVRKGPLSFSALCPFHNEKTPSFKVYNTNTFHCFGCKANGDAIDFIIQLKGLDFIEAVRHLTGK